MKHLVGKKGEASTLRKYPDQLTHEQHFTWRIHKNQAKYRKEPYELTFAQYKEFWDHGHRWINRGRLKNNIRMVRIDKEKAWKFDNLMTKRIKSSKEAK